jgi:hypothetical protein
MSFITYLEQDKEKVLPSMNEKIAQLRQMLFDKGCSVEKRPNGYFSIMRQGGSNRKVRFMVNTTNTNFCYEIVDSKDESAAIMRENLMSVSNDEIINDIMGYIT